MKTFEVTYREEYGGTFRTTVNAYNETHAKNIVNKWRSTKEVVSVKRLTFNNK